MLVLLWRGNFQVRSFVVVTLLTIAFTDGVFTQFMKKLVNRPRPSQALAEVREVNLEKTKPAILGVWRPVQVSLSKPPEGPVIGRSFPSGPRHEQHHHCHLGYSIFWKAAAPSTSFLRDRLLLQDLLRLALAQRRHCFDRPGNRLQPDPRQYRQPDLPDGSRRSGFPSLYRTHRSLFGTPR